MRSKISKVIMLMCVVIVVALLTGCGKSDAIKFKESYEALNGKTNTSGNEHRTVTINEKNPYIFTDAEDIVGKIENKETFYVYFGSKLCPWCRSVIEKSIEVANKNNIDKIYYVDIWDNDGNEILRDKYVLEANGSTKKTALGTDAYYKLLEYLNDVIGDYEVGDIKEKRIYAPTYIYIENGVAVKATDGLSSKQTGSRDELTDEILLDEEKQFSEFFASYCDNNC